MLGKLDMKLAIAYLSRKRILFKSLSKATTWKDNKTKRGPKRILPVYNNISFVKMNINI